jgi:hypothetical protein
MFNLTEYIKRNLINGFADGTWTESKVAQLSVGYYEKELLTAENIEEIDTRIQEIKEQRENEVLEDIADDSDNIADADSVDNIGNDGE